MKTITNILELLIIGFCMIVASLLITGCGTMSRMELQADGSYKEIPLMNCKTFARDLSYSYTETITSPDGTVTVKSEQYSTKGTTAGIIGAGAGLLGAASNLSPL